VITGFNTDIKHGERVFHVQTEDRGAANPVVESLVYVGGEILLSKKSSYGEHVVSGRVDEKVVRDVMDLQHRRIIEAIRRGRFDGATPGAQPPPDEMTETGTPFNAAPPGVSPAAAAAAAAIMASKSGAMPSIRPPGAAAPAPRPRPPSQPAMKVPSSPGVSGEKSLDQVIMEYLASEAASEHLDLSLMKGGDLVPGDTVPLTVRASTSLTEQPIAGAHVSIRVVSTVAPPQILFRGVTGSDGLVKATCAIPDLGTAHAALIIAASSPIGNNELKETIKKKVR
jgi:hypothetical protein